MNEDRPVFTPMRPGPLRGVLIVAMAWSAALAAEKKAPPEWITDGPYVEQESFLIELPVRTLATKLFIEVEVGGVPRRFVFDTGSPSMLSAELAAELELEVIDQVEGRDSHGAIIRSDIVQMDLTLDGTTFRKVPVFVADFSSSRVAQCLMDGVLGSEVLPLCAWQIDLSESVLRCDTELERLDLKGAEMQRMSSFGYPHTPLLDVRFTDRARSMAMFDTGSSQYFTISPPDFEAVRASDGVDRSVAGYGSAGESLGGQAPVGTQVRSSLRSLSIGNIELRNLAASTRESPPSLIGASILEHYVVTLSQATESIYFRKYGDKPISRASFGFSPAFGQGVSVGLVWDDSPAAEAGMHAGQDLLSINGENVDSSCAGIEKVIETLHESETIDVSWDDGKATLTRRDLPE